MASDIFTNILEQKIDNFASTFGDGATNIFTKDKKIIHPLEYGMYKERCAKELLSFVTNKDTGISDGFLITADNNVSTQCDIIMYQNNTIPLLDNGIANFYPIEIVKGIGEIKSTLNKTDFSNALVKLAKNKMMFAQRKGNSITSKRMFEENNEIFSFLICNKLSFDISEINFDDIYKDIPDLRYRHNAILSLQDGVITYNITFSEAPQKQRQDFIQKEGNINTNPRNWYYPHHSHLGECYKCNINFQRIDSNDKYAHIKEFLIGIRTLLRAVYEYEFDFVCYLSSDIIPLFDKSSHL